MDIDIIAWAIIIATAIIFIGVVGKVVADPPSHSTCLLAGIIFLGVGAMFLAAVGAVVWALIRVVGGM